MLRALFAIKPFATLVAETEASPRSLRRVLGPGHLIALGVGATVGAGIFATIGTAAAGDAQRPGAGPPQRIAMKPTRNSVSARSL